MPLSTQYQKLLSTAVALLVQGLDANQLIVGNKIILNTSPLSLMPLSTQLSQTAQHGGRAACSGSPRESSVIILNTSPLSLMPLSTQLSQTAQHSGLHANQLIVGNNIKHIVGSYVKCLHRCCLSCRYRRGCARVNTIAPSRH
jgi:hypothetical protein